MGGLDKIVMISDDTAIGGDRRIGEAVDITSQDLADLRLAAEHWVNMAIWRSRLIRQERGGS